MGYVSPLSPCPARSLTCALQKEVLHELEIEFSDMPLLIHEGQKNARGEDSLYYDLIQVFLNNIRM